MNRRRVFSIDVSRSDLNLFDHWQVRKFPAKSESNSCQTNETFMQRWNAACYAKNVRFVSELGAGVLQWLNAQAGERILDLGCGDGQLSAQLMQSGCDVLGIDASEDMVRATRSLGVNAEVVSGEALAFDGEFDAVFSNAALHWMKRADAVASGVYRALRPGGRFVAEFGGRDNVAAVINALSSCLQERGIDAERANPWYFPSEQTHRELLQCHGFEVRRMTSFERPTPLPGHLKAWLETFAQSFSAMLPSADHERFLDDVCERLQPQLYDDATGWTVDYVRLRFEAVKAR